jgi:hypothetical protein
MSARAADIDIEAAPGCGGLDVERLAVCQERLGERPRRIQCSRQCGIEDRTTVDRNEVVRVCGSKSDPEHLMRAHARMERDAAPAEAVRIDQRRHFAIELRLLERLDDQIALPGAVLLHLPMLNCAAAADAKMRTERRDPRGACDLDRKQAPAVGMMTGNGRHLDRLAGKRVRHIDGLAIDKADAVATMAHMIDQELLNHVARR